MHDGCAGSSFLHMYTYVHTYIHAVRESPVSHGGMDLFIAHVYIYIYIHTYMQYVKAMCLMVVGSSLLRIDDNGILPEIREQALRCVCVSLCECVCVCVCVCNSQRPVSC